MRKIIFVLAFVTLVKLAMSCPSSSDLSPCFCEYMTRSFQVTCPGVDNEHFIIMAVYALRQSSHFFKFVIRDGVFMFVPHDAFKGLSFQELEIIDSSFMALSDTSAAFEGLEESLAALTIKNSTVLNDWDWLVLENVKGIEKLHVDVDLEIVSKDISRIGSAGRVKSLSLADNEITFVEDEAFAGFLSLASLSLRDNQISELKRSMFPNQADKLWHLDFGGNQIEQIPPDLFDNMPNLTSLLIGGNKLLSLNEQPFAKVWSQLTNFNALGNKLTCDCRMEWMIKRTFPTHLDAVCAFPPQLQDKNLNQLTTFDLWCMWIDA